MDLVYLVIGLALLQFFVFGMFVGYMRVKTGVSAPAVSGDPLFERYYRVHYNTMESLVVFIPGILLFAHYIHMLTAVVLGLLFIVGRTVYFRSYINDPAKRGMGYGLTMLPIIVFLLGGIGGAFWSLIATG